MDYSSQSYSLLPQEPGVYFFIDKKGKVLYVGKARSLKKRVSSYFTHKIDLLEKTRLLINKTSKIKIIRTEGELDALLLEANFIKKYKPRFNTIMRDDKNYPLIRITIKDKYPKVLIARRQEDKKSLYFGPYPNARELKTVLSLIRKVFPFQSVVNHPKKLCLCHHLGLCPCPLVFDTKENRKSYYKNIKHIIDLLNGKTKKIIKELEKERNLLSKSENFEGASDLQKKIKALQSVTQQKHLPFEYEENPNLLTDLRKKEIVFLTKSLRLHGIRVQKLTKIECFDISNISGKFATGSMVVFINGEKESSLYRRFKIRSEEKPNDFAMIREVVERRLKHNEWQLPDLIIVDGGKGQISAALKALEELHTSIPVIGLAKKEETIITSDFRKISLPKNSRALHFVMRIRDEAHRFAISYHKKIRSKYFLTS